MHYYLLLYLDECFLFKTIKTIAIIAIAINNMIVNGTKTSKVMKSVETASPVNSNKDYIEC